MAVTKFSRQRAAIKDYLMHTTAHPIAETVYSCLQVIHPNISLGTIYRNLNLLVGQGEVIKFATGDGKDRFDANTSPHYHFVCTECSNVSDVFMSSDFISMVTDSAKSEIDGEILGHSTFFFGRCLECKDA